MSWRTVIIVIAVVWAISFAFIFGQLASGQQIMPQATLDAVRAGLPLLEDEDANALLHSDEVVWYSTNEMPASYQHQNGNGITRTTFHWAGYNISADPSDRHLPHGQGGNGAIEFPWLMGKPGGAHNAVGVASVKGFYFPKPAAVFERTVPGRVGSGNRAVILDWVFAEGTTFFEVIYQAIRQEHVVFEVRSRTKEGDEWAVDIFRPFATAEELADAIEEMGEGKNRAEAIASLRSTETLPTMRLADDTHTRKRAFEATSEVYDLPVQRTDDVVRLLERPFVSCLGTNFKGEAAAPSNASKFVGLVPPNYHGAFVGNDRQACMQCHESAGHHVTTFQQRGWYGLVPGGFSEKILSWHPVEPSSISYNGGNRQRVLRKSFVDAGLITFVRGQLPEGYQFTKVDQ